MNNYNLNITSKNKYFQQILKESLYFYNFSENKKIAV